MRLMKIDGPECPRCGCEETELLKSVPYEMRRANEIVESGVRESRQCQHCGERFTAQLPEA